MTICQSCFLPIKPGEQSIVVSLSGPKHMHTECADVLCRDVKAAIDALNPPAPAKSSRKS